MRFPGGLTFMSMVRQIRALPGEDVGCLGGRVPGAPRSGQRARNGSSRREAPDESDTIRGLRSPSSLHLPQESLRDFRWLENIPLSPGRSAFSALGLAGAGGTWLFSSFSLDKGRGHYQDSVRAHSLSAGLGKGASGGHLGRPVTLWPESNQGFSNVTTL